MTLTVRVSRVPINQLNLDHAGQGKTCMSKHAANCTHQHTHRQTKKHKRVHKHATGDGSSRAQFPPVLSQLLVDLGHPAASSRKKDEESGGDGKMEREEWIERGR